MINYIKGDLFELAPQGAFLAHAVNCQGVWGAGIAKTFKKLYPIDFKQYKEYACQGVVGNYLITHSNIICLFTSVFYDKERIAEGDIILNHTYMALMHLEYGLPKNAVVYSNKFNSGLFNVPWQHTEYLLECFLARRPDVQWTVVEYET